ncbi:MAG: TatD family hydrolase [Clostridia bacterium]|nr:TatD family hydrolase [Clostridia bacterium]
MYFDSHAHYTDEAFAADRESLIKSLPGEGIEGFVNIGASIAESMHAVNLAEQYPYAYAAIGVHPENAAEVTAQGIEQLRRLSEHEKVVAIGEIGLDYHYDDVPRDVQKDAFRKQLALAESTGLPVVIHDREAHGDTMDILRKHLKTGGVMHCFSGSTELAREVLDLGMYIALGGVVTYKNAVKTVEVAKTVPLDKLLLETDCPYLSPVPNRGKRNSSLNLPFTAAKIAEVRGISIAEVAARTTENAKRLFGILG